MSTIKSVSSLLIFSAFATSVSAQAIAHSDGHRYNFQDFTEVTVGEETHQLASLSADDVVSLCAIAASDFQTFNTVGQEAVTEFEGLADNQALSLREFRERSTELRQNIKASIAAQNQALLAILVLRLTAQRTVGGYAGQEAAKACDTTGFQPTARPANM